VVCLAHLPPSPPRPPTPQGEQWKQTTLRTALAFPGFVSAIFLTLNFLVWGQKSSGAVPFGTLCALVFLWCGISVPLCFVGSYFGYKKAAPEVRQGQQAAAGS
jgi:transmembrane 9 superfamily protein 2/4